MNDDVNMEGVLRRIQKLLAIAGDERADAAEAAAAAGMAERLMRKFQLDNDAVLAAKLRSDPRSGMSSKDIFANMKRDDPSRPPAKTNPSWAQQIAVGVARLNECEVRQGWGVDKFGKTTACMKLFGYAADVEVAAWTFDALVSAMLRGCAAFNSANGDRVAGEAYRRGFVAALCMALQRATAEKSAAAVAGRALVVAKAAAIQEAFGTFKYVQRKGSGVRNYGAFAAGQADGRRVDVTQRAVGGGEVRNVARLSA